MPVLRQVLVFLFNKIDCLSRLPRHSKARPRVYK